VSIQAGKVERRTELVHLVWKALEERPLGGGLWGGGEDNDWISEGEGRENSFFQKKGGEFSAPGS